MTMHLNDTANRQSVQTASLPLTSDAYFETGTKTGDFALAVHAGMLRIHHPRSGLAEFPPVGAIRGTVKGFSRASRKRMIEMLASIRGAGSMMFATFTYPDSFPQDPSTWHHHFEALRDRLEEHFPQWRAIWRIELMNRKSGENFGALAPHWHLLIFLPGAQFGPDALNIAATMAAGVLRQMWYEIVASGDELHLLHGVDVSPVRSIRHAMSYVSKYIAKTCPDGLEIGRRWGRIGRFDTSASITVKLTLDEYVVMKRMVRNWMRKRGGKFHRKFARQSPQKGCSILGMGDLFGADWFAFVYEAFRQVAEMRFLERGYGD